MEMIKIQGLNKSFQNKVVLQDINMTVEEGMLVGLLGVNGAGKSTLIRILSGLLKKDSGKVFISGLDLDSSLDEIHKIINVSPQESALAENLTVKENLVFFQNIYSSKDEISDLIRDFDLYEVLDKKTKNLSGGYKRRLSIAVSLVSKPKVLFLDEPTLGLDVLSRRSLWKCIERLKGKMTIVLTSHYLEEIEALSDRVDVLDKGCLLFSGTVNEIKKREKSASLEEAFVSLVEEKR